METVLIVDSSPPYLNRIESLLGNEFSVASARSEQGASQVLEVERVSVVMLGALPDSSGLKILSMIRRTDSDLPVIVISDFVNTDSVVEAMRLGAYDVIRRDFHRELVVEKIKKAIERRSLAIKAHALQSSFAAMHDRFVFASEAMARVNQEIKRLAAVDFDVLITGESGVGKDLVAYEIHKQSGRADQAFIPLPMKALSESLMESELFGHEKGAFSGAERRKIGKLEAAEGGTVYLPEVSSLTESVQLKLLHFMQYKTVTRVGQDPRKPERKVDVRLIMSTNEELEGVVRSRKMRVDFYHRICGVRITVPPLRDRIEDVEPLASYFCAKHARAVNNIQHECSPEVVAAFKAYGWSGNVRELENLIKNAIAYSNSKVLTLDDFPHFAELKANKDDCRLCLSTRFQVLPPYKSADMAFKRAYFSEVLRRTGNRLPQAASVAGLTYQGLSKIINALHLLGDRKVDV